MNTDSRVNPIIVARRAELLAELFLTDLEPSFIAKSTGVADSQYDFLVGFQNKDGGTNLVAVEVKAIEKPVQKKYRLSTNQYRLFAYSNLPTLLLVVDVKNNVFYYALLQGEIVGIEHSKTEVYIPLQAVEEMRDFKVELVASLSQIATAPKL